MISGLNESSKYVSEVLDIWTCPIVATLLQSELGVNSSVKEERGRGAEDLYMSMQPMLNMCYNNNYSHQQR